MENEARDLYMSSPVDSQPALVRIPSAWVRAGEHFFPRRIVVGIAGLCIGALLVRPRNLFGEFQLAGTAISIALIAAGLSLRAWAAACAGNHTRSSKIEAPRLVTGGPYAFVRNPIYLGSFVLGLGMVGLLGDPWLFVPHLLVFAVFFGLIIPAEEQFLERQFGEEYCRFRRAVPKLFPMLRPWRGGSRPTLCWRGARGEAKIALLLVAIYWGFRGLLLFQASPA
jgi:protein-S-isoprenylcysteine O-methyltransferase Ste14